MSRENVETVRRLAEHWNGGDHRLPPELLDPAIELESPLSSVRGESYRGHSGMEEWSRSIDEQFDEWRLSAAELHEVGDAVLAIGVAHIRGRGSGIELDQPAACILDFGADRPTNPPAGVISVVACRFGA
jgi:hypothetical protein